VLPPASVAVAVTVLLALMTASVIVNVPEKLPCASVSSAPR
jgi:hypothetical protein